MSQHGPQFDAGFGQPDAPHGGTEYDEGFTRNPGRESQHGPLADDDYRKLARISQHGDRWDEFGWRQMPAKHGQNFDSDFGQHVALEGGKHGTWRDVFRGGTNVRYLDGGRDVEGIIIRCTPTHAVVQQRYTENQGGKRRDLTEVGLGQIIEWRWADQLAANRPKPVAHPGDTPADVPDRTDSPSLSARGGGRTAAPAAPGPKAANKTVDEDPDDLVEKAFAELGPDLLGDVAEIAKAHGKRGSATTASAPIHASRATTAPRHPNGKVDHAAARQILTQRSAAFRAGVAAKREHTLPKIHHGGFTCTGCGHNSFREHQVAHAAGGVHKQVAMRGCASCGLMHPHRVGKTELVDLDVTKTVDTAETALLAQDQEGGSVEKVGHRSGCPRGGSAPCGADEAGKCTACGADVHDHEATGKTLLTDPLTEVRKLARVAG